MTERAYRRRVDIVPAVGYCVAKDGRQPHKERLMSDLDDLAGLMESYQIPVAVAFDVSEADVRRAARKIRDYATVPDPCSRCGGRGYVNLPMDRKGEDDTCPACGGTGQTEEGLSMMHRQGREIRRVKARR